MMMTFVGPASTDFSSHDTDRKLDLDDKLAFPDGTVKATIGIYQFRPRSWNTMISLVFHDLFNAVKLTIFYFNTG